MKRLLLFFVCALCVLSSVYADIRTPEQAGAIASALLKEATENNGNKMPASPHDIQLFRTLYKTDLDLEENLPISSAPQRRTHIDNDETEPALYMFNDDKAGFVVVSADTRAADVLAYSMTGTLTDSDLAPGFMWLMERFVEEISSLTEADDAMSVSLRRAPQTFTPIEPLLGKIEWGQYAPYNNKCPIDTYDNTRSVTGCVATAAAQIMCYWRWPVSGTGSHSYTWTNQNNSSIKTTLSLNFASITFDWDNMLPSYKGEYTTAQADAVATLMYACGVAVNMKYGGNSTSGSSSVTDNMATAMGNYLGYQYEGDLGSSYNKNLDNNSIYSGTTTYAQYYSEYFNDDLENGRPILMSGLSSGGGHAFVCDGRDSDGNFHINWGWMGASNCYTPLTAIRPGYPKHNDLYFKTRMYATYGLRPNSTCINTTNHTTVSETEDRLPYLWRGLEIKETGVYEDVETDEGGCTTTYVLHFTARPAGTDGMCGDNLFYTYDAATHTLTITGTGDMWEYDFLSTPGRKTPWYPYASDIRIILLPEGMTGISAFAFAYCSNLTDITVPSTITSIGAQPFFGCTSLRSITWNAVSCATASARPLAPFYDVRGQITSFAFGDGVQTIPGALCYEMTNLTSVVLPNDLEAVKIWAFAGCSGLIEITFESVTPPTLGTDAFSDVPTAAVVYVPCGSIPGYSASTLPFTDYRSHCGYCEENNGTNLEWEYTGHTLTITGEGNMETYAAEDDMPWYDVRAQIENVSLTDEANQQPMLSWLTTRSGTNVTIRRTLWADGYLNTLCLPFSLTAGEVQTFLPHAELYTFASARAVTGELLITLSSSSDITAGVPYLVRFPTEDDDIVNPTFTNVRVSATTGQTDGAGEVTFVGVLKPNDMIANNTNQLMVGTNDELFWADVNDYMKAYRAYFQIDAASSSPIRKGMPARVVLEQQTPTDLTGAQQADSNRQCEKVIINGQFIIRTNGCEYNAQGQKR